MNVQKTMVVVIIFAPTVLEVLNVLVDMEFIYIMMEGHVQVAIHYS